MKELKLYMVLLGCRPKGRFTEQHDIFFGIAPSLKKLAPQILKSWPEAKGVIHIDAWREVTEQDGYVIKIVNRKEVLESKQKIFFINLGGYKKGEFEEYHYKMLTIAKNSIAAIKQAKKTVFYKHTGIKGAVSHIDDKYGIDVDDVYLLTDILAPMFKEKHTIKIELKKQKPDKIHLGYLTLDKIKK